MKREQRVSVKTIAACGADINCILKPNYIKSESTGISIGNL